jgi:diphthamide biosynthesis protein 3
LNRLKVNSAPSLRLAPHLQANMSVYEEVEIEDMTYDEKDLSYTYPCPCGDMFRITLEELFDGEDIAKCPSCTLRIRVIYEKEDLPLLPPEDDDEEGVVEEELLVRDMQAISVK